MIHPNAKVVAAMWALLAGFGWAAGAGAKAPDNGADGATILDSGSFWRVHVTLRKPVVLGSAAGEDPGAPGLAVQVPYRSYPGVEQIETPPPPGEWVTPDFDDADWPRARAGLDLPASVAEVAFAPAVQFSAGLLCLRGKFTVTDPAAVEGLKLSMTYRGGVVVYLNGRRVAAGGLPEGAAGPQTPGLPYPDEAYVDSQGKPIPGPYHAGKRIKAGEKDLADRIARRDRVLGPLALPAEALRKGVNVLAIELHRSDYHASSRLWFREPHSRTEPAWVPVGPVGMRLTARGTGAAANVARPRGFQVWNADPNDRINVLDYGDPNEVLGPIRLTAVRNGAFSGKVVVGSTQPIRGLSATVGELVAAGGGKAVIPAQKVEVRYAVLNGHAYQRPDWFDGLTSAAPGEVPLHKTGAAVQPVWVTVHVPRGATPGEYRGTLAIAADGAERSSPTTVPIHVSVADWALGDPRDFRTYVGVYQSPTSLAIQYQVPEWSPRHWELMDKSFELLGQVGNKIVNVPISNRTQFGNDEGMVYWVEKPGGGYDYDLTVFDRYMGLVARHLGVPDFVVLHVWHSGGWQSRGAQQENTVTVVDPKTHSRRAMQVPPFGTDQSKAFWKPVLDAIRKRLAGLGMDKGVCLGILSDGTAPPEVFRAFDEIVPGGAKWTRGCHTQTRERKPYPLKGGGGVVCHEFCYGMAMADPAKALPEIWKQRAWPGVAFIRHNFDDSLSLLKYRTMAERSLYCGTRGIGRIGLDFWDVMPDARGRRGNIYNRWPNSSCAQREPNLFRLSWPGPQGPAATARFEQFRQGVQDAEAVIFVAEALGEHSADLGPELARRCRDVYTDRIARSLRTCSEAYGCIYFRKDHQGWRDLTARLYAAAADAARKLAAARDRP